jgi:ATP/maltotriose-dependent transcriptional regulator MalT
VAAGLESLRLYQRSDAGAGTLSRVLSTLGYARLFGGDADGARADLEKARDLAHESGDLYGEARALSHLAVVEGHIGDYPSIRRHLEACGQIALQIHDVRRLTSIDQSLAVADHYEGLLENSRRRHTRGRRRAVAIGDRQILAYFDLTLGAVERSAGRFDPAQAAFESSEKLARASGIVLARELARTGLGWTAVLRGRLDEARVHLLSSVPEDSQDPLAVMQRLVVMGLLSLESGEPSKARAQAEDALRIAGGSPKFEPLAVDVTLRAALVEGDASDARLTECTRALDLAHKINVPEYTSRLLCTRALIEIARGMPSEAAASAADAVARARAHGLLPALVSALLIRGRALMAGGGLYDDRAEDSLEECQGLATEIGMEPAAREAEAGLVSLRGAWGE